MAMAAAAVTVTNAVEDIDAGEPDALSDNICLNDIVSLSSNGVHMQEPGNAGEILTRVELDVAYCSEKLLNLDVLLMRVSARENEFESLDIESNDISEESAKKGLEFDLLCGVLESELKELNNFMASLQTEITDAHQKNSSRELLKESFIEIEEKLHDSEETLKQSQNQLGEMKMQFAKFRRSLSSVSGQEACNSKDADSSENGHFSNRDTKLKMQTVEQQKHILRMLEKSLARELDMENKLSDSRNSEEEFKKKLHSAEQDLYWMEEDAEDIFGRLFEAENAAELLTGISKGLVGRLQLLQFNLNGSIQREADMKSELDNSMEQSKTKENSLSKLESSSSSDLNELENVISDLKGNMAKEESRSNSLETKCTALTKTNMELNEELGSLRSDRLENVNALEKKLMESNIQLQHAKVSAEASQEQQNMLYSAIDDMENLIEDLKSRVSKAESRTDKAETKCALLSETILEINEELAFLRNRTECLEISLNQADDEKIVTAKKISIRTTAISDLVLRLSTERERLQNQILSVIKENKALAAKSEKNPVVTMKHISEDDLSTCAKASEEAVAESSAFIFQVDKLSKDATVFEDGVKAAMSTEDASVGVSSVETVRSIDVWQLNSKYLVPILILLISVLALYLFQLEKCPF